MVIGIDLAEMIVILQMQKKDRVRRGRLPAELLPRPRPGRAGSTERSPV
jgi:hypothetical protein